LFRTVPLGPWDESSPRAHWRHRAAGQPFFAVISPQVTHESRLFMPADQFAKETAHVTPEDRHNPAKATLPPYYPDTPAARANWARYYDMWTEADDQVGEILRELDEDGLASSTIVLFGSDHGRGFPRAKRWAYDSGTHVPFVRWPGRLPAGTVRDDLISYIDLPATTLALAGVPIPKHFQGQVFLGPNAAPPREFVYVHRDRMEPAAVWRQVIEREQPGPRKREQELRRLAAQVDSERWTARGATGQKRHLPAIGRSRLRPRRRCCDRPATGRT
jgi:uncharacterized sulfatase